MPSRPDDQPAAEVMPRPPESCWPEDADGEVSDRTGVLAAVAEQHRRTTALHERFLKAQHKFYTLLAQTGVAAARDEQHESEIAIETGAWYLDGAGRMTAGAVLDTVFALGPTHGERDFVCTVTFHDGLPAPGQLLCGDVTVAADDESFRGAARVDGRNRLSVRGTWSPRSDDHREPAMATGSPHGRVFDSTAVRAFADGRPAECFGPDWDMTRAHVRTPHISGPGALSLDEITAGDPASRRLRAHGRMPRPEWASPAAAVLEGCLQVTAFSLATTGCTIDRDGWRFEPAPDAPCTMRWRNQEDGEDRLCYEVFVQSAASTPFPTVHADVVCTTAHGTTVLRAENLAVRLVPDTPLNHWRTLGPATTQKTGNPVPLHVLGGLRDYHDPAPAAMVGAIRFDFATLLADAWGPMSDVFGDSAAGTDALGTIRLPGPPYLFVTRVTEVSGTLGGLEVGSALTAEYDVPEQVWFLEENGTREVPLAVLMEIALQPCGVLAAYIGSAVISPRRSRIRNLDGDLAISREVPAGVRTLRTTVELTHLDRWDDTLLETYRVRCSADGIPVLEGTTVFALSPADVLHRQNGMHVGPVDRERLAEPCDRPTVDLRSRPARYFGRPLRLPGPMLLMLDRITGYWPDGGPAELGRLRAETDIRADAWYFKAHFFTDPVQPGSLGVEAMCQLLQYYLIERGIGTELHRPRFVPLDRRQQLIWSYRGQVVPTDDMITIEMNILDVVTGETGCHADAEAWLWVDGRRAYHVPHLRVRVVPGSEPENRSPAFVDTVLDPGTDDWLSDHCPDWTNPVLPLVSTADMLVTAVRDYTGRDVRALQDVQARRWLPVPEPTRLRLTTHGHRDELTASLAVWRDAPDPSFARFAPVATATVGNRTPVRPSRFEPLPESRAMPCPYETAALFHGPRFQYLVEWRLGSLGSSGTLRADKGAVPRGALHQGLLDAALHIVPHDDLWQWDPRIDPAMLSFPHRITDLSLFDRLPDSGAVEVEARYAGLDQDDPRVVAVDLQLCVAERVLAAFRLVDILFPAGPLGEVSAGLRRSYLRDHKPVPELLLSREEAGTTVLHKETLNRTNILPGLVPSLYGLPSGARAGDWLPHITAKEHLARLIGVHPNRVGIDPDLRVARGLDPPHAQRHIDVTWDEDVARVRDRLR